MVNKRKDKDLKVDDKKLKKESSEKVAGGRKPVIAYGGGDWFKRGYLEELLNDEGDECVDTDMVDRKADEKKDKDLIPDNELLESKELRGVTGGESQNYDKLSSKVWRKIWRKKSWPSEVEVLAYGGPSFDTDDGTIDDSDQDLSLEDDS